MTDLENLVWYRAYVIRKLLSSLADMKLLSSDPRTRREIFNASTRTVMGKIAYDGRYDNVQKSGTDSLDISKIYNPSRWHF